MKLFDATLDLAMFAKGTEDYTVSSVNGPRIICNDLSGRVHEFGGGTIWIHTGESAGYFGKIRSGKAQTIELMTELPVAEGDQITIGAWQEFDTQTLINAVNSVLRNYKIMKTNEDLKYKPEKEYYDLPEEVTEDVRKVFIEGFWPVSGLKGDYMVCSHYWRVEDQQLVIYDKHYNRYMKDGEIKLYYVDYHGPVSRHDKISGQVDPQYLRYMSWLYLCRNLIQKTHKDNLAASDMYNEAKIYERDYGQLPNKRLMTKTMVFPSW